MRLLRRPHSILQVYPRVQPLPPKSWQGQPSTKPKTTRDDLYLPLRPPLSPLQRRLQVLSLLLLLLLLSLQKPLLLLLALPDLVFSLMSRLRHSLRPSVIRQSLQRKPS
jgi:hypothetical protein